MLRQEQWIIVVGCLMLEALCVLGSISPEQALAYLQGNNHVFCPRANICGTKNKQVDFNQCCADCSCDDDCHLFDNCCLPSNLTNPFADLQTCEPLTVANYLAHLHVPRMSMISKCPNESTDTHLGSGAASARDSEDLIANLWGNMFPVYSRSTGLVYKHPSFAACHGVSDPSTDEFAINIGCLGEDFYRLLHAIQTNTFPVKCAVFVTLESQYSEDILKHICFKDVINTCSESTFPVPENVNMTQEEIIGSCESGLYAPYDSSAFKHKVPFANIFCYVCNIDILYRPTHFCDTFYPADFPKIEQFPITALVSSPMVSSKSKLSSKIPCRVFTGLNDSGECREVICPSGQTRNPEDGKCSHVLEIKAKRYRIALYLKLQLPNTLKINDLNPFDKRINRPLKMLWSIDTLYYTKDNNGTLTSLYIVLLHNIPDMRLSIVLKHVKLVLKNSWTVLYQDSDGVDRTLEMTPYLYKESKPCLVRHDFPEIYFMSRFPPYETFFKFFDGAKDSPLLFHVTKLYFCNQVRLKHWEYELGKNDCYVNLTSTARTLYSNEFARFSLPGGHDIVQVCIDDIPHSSASQIGFGTSNSFLQMALVYVCTTLAITLTLHIQ